MLLHSRHHFTTLSLAYLTVGLDCSSVAVGGVVQHVLAPGLDRRVAGRRGRSGITLAHLLADRTRGSNPALIVTVVNVLAGVDRCCCCCCCSGITLILNEFSSAEVCLLLMVLLLLKRMGLKEGLLHSGAR